MASKAKIEKFETTNKANIRGRVGHSRTGACTSQGKCNHGMKPHRVVRGKKKGK